jgi:hypothetical protein
VKKRRVKKLKTRYQGKVKYISGVKIRKSARPLLKTLKKEAGDDFRVLVFAGGHKVVDK